MSHEHKIGEDCPFMGKSKSEADMKGATNSGGLNWLLETKLEN